MFSISCKQYIVHSWLTELTFFMFVFILFSFLRRENCTAKFQNKITTSVKQIKMEENTTNNKRINIRILRHLTRYN